MTTPTPASLTSGSAQQVVRPTRACVKPRALAKSRGLRHDDDGPLPATQRKRLGLVARHVTCSHGPSCLAQCLGQQSKGRAGEAPADQQHRLVWVMSRALRHGLLLPRFTQGSPRPGSPVQSAPAWDLAPTPPSSGPLSSPCSDGRREVESS